MIFWLLSLSRKSVVLRARLCGGRCTLCGYAIFLSFIYVHIGMCVLCVCGNGSARVCVCVCVVCVKTRVLSCVCVCAVCVETRVLSCVYICVYIPHRYTCPNNVKLWLCIIRKFPGIYQQSEHKAELFMIRLDLCPRYGIRYKKAISARLTELGRPCVPPPV